MKVEMCRPKDSVLDRLSNSTSAALVEQTFQAGFNTEIHDMFDEALGSLGRFSSEELHLHSMFHVGVAESSVAIPVTAETLSPASKSQLTALTLDICEVRGT